MLRFILLFVLWCALPLVVPHGSALGQNQFTLNDSVTAIPDSVYWFPDGNNDADSSWLRLTKLGHASQFFVFYLAADSVAGFDAPCSVHVEIRTGNSLDTLAYLNYTTSGFVFNDKFNLVPLDTSWICQVPAYLHRDRRYRITVSDTIKLWIKEQEGR